MVEHSEEDHPGEPRRFKMEPICFPRSNLLRQATEAMEIEKHRSKNVINRRREWDQNLPPKLSIESNEGDGDVGSKGKRKMRTRNPSKNGPMNLGANIDSDRVEQQVAKRARIQGHYQESKKRVMSRKPQGGEQEEPEVVCSTLKGQNLISFTNNARGNEIPPKPTKRGDPEPSRGCLNGEKQGNLRSSFGVSSQERTSQLQGQEDKRFGSTRTTISFVERTTERDISA